MNNVIRFPASTARKPTKRTKPSPALSPEQPGINPRDAELLANLAELPPEDADVWRLQIRAAAAKSRRERGYSCR
jgi:hypothetical protein